MKRSLIIMTLFALCLTFNQAHAQRYLPGMKALQVTAGMAGGVHWNDNTDFAYHIGVAYSVYTKNANRWVFGGEYLEKRYNYKTGGKPFSCRWDCRHSPGTKRATGTKRYCRMVLHCWIRIVLCTAGL